MRCSAPPGVVLSIKNNHLLCVALYLPTLHDHVVCRLVVHKLTSAGCQEKLSHLSHMSSLHHKIEQAFLSFLSHVEKTVGHPQLRPHIIYLFPIPNPHTLFSVLVLPPIFVYTRAHAWLQASSVSQCCSEEDWFSMQSFLVY